MGKRLRDDDLLIIHARGAKCQKCGQFPVDDLVIGELLFNVQGRIDVLRGRLADSHEAQMHIEETASEAFAKNTLLIQERDQFQADNAALREAAQKICDLPIQSEFIVVREAVLELSATLASPCPGADLLKGRKLDHEVLAARLAVIDYERGLNATLGERVKTLEEKNQNLSRIAIVANPPGCWNSPNPFDRNYTPGAIKGCGECPPCKRRKAKEGAKL